MTADRANGGAALEPPVVSPLAGVAARAEQLDPPIDLGPVRLLARRSLLKLLDQISEPKTLLLDAALAGPLGLVCDVGSLRAHGVERMFWLEEPKDGKQGVVRAASAGEAVEDVLQGLIKDVNAPTRAVVYACRPDLALLRVISGHIVHDRKTATSATALRHTYHALFSPRRSELALQLLGSLASPPILSDLNLYDLGLELVPLEHDVLSLEEPSAWADIWARGDHGVIYRSAMALMTLQHIYGAFPQIIGKGDMAQRLCSLLLRQRREFLASDPTNPALQNPSQSIDSLVIIDRSVDLATPLCTQLTYEGLLDEVIGIKSAHIEIDESAGTDGRGAGDSGAGTSSASTMPLQPSSRKLKKIRLDKATDPLFGSVRDENFAIVGERLHQSAMQLNEDSEKVHSAKTVAEIRAVAGKLGGFTKAKTSLRLHTDLTERIMEYTTSNAFNASLELQQNIVAGFDLGEQLVGIEELMLSEAPRNAVLRLLCLLSVVGGGIKPKNLEYFQHELVQTYGYQNIALLSMLVKTGLLAKATPSSARVTTGFAAARNALRLIVDDVDEKDPHDVSYVLSGFAPLSVRLVQAVAQKEALLGQFSAMPPASSRKPLPRAHAIKGWRGSEDILQSLPGATFAETQSRHEGRDGVRASLMTNGNKNGDSRDSVSKHDRTAQSRVPGEDGTTTTMVFFLGGVTFAEISALRLMSTQSRNRRFVVATTNIINGDVMLETLQDV